MTSSSAIDYTTPPEPSTVAPDAAARSDQVKAQARQRKPRRRQPVTLDAPQSRLLPQVSDGDLAHVRAILEIPNPALEKLEETLEIEPGDTRGKFVSTDLELNTGARIGATVISTMDPETLKTLQWVGLGLFALSWTLPRAVIAWKQVKKARALERSYLEQEARAAEGKASS